MPTYAKQKGQSVSPSRGRSGNQPTSGFVQKSGVSQKPWANSRTPVHPNLDRHSSVGAKKERKD